MDRKVHFLDLVKFLILLHVSYFVRIELFLDTVKILKARFLVTFMQICNENCSIIKTIILLKILEKSDLLDIQRSALTHCNPQEILA